MEARLAKREHGLDVLKVFVMMMIVIYHCIGEGGIIDNASRATYQVFAALKCLAICAVNVYAIISGYTCIHSKNRYERLLMLWIEVFFYSVLGYAIYSVVTHSFGKKALLTAVFPVLGKEFWYFSSYFALALAIPFLNILLNKLTKRQWHILLLGIALLSCMSLPSCLLDIDFLKIRDGFSPLWLGFMYILGAYLKIFAEKFDTVAWWMWLLGYLACSLLTFLSKPAIAFVTERVIGHATMDGMFWSYLSPFVVGAAVCLFQLFRKIKITRTQKLWKLLASATFGAYIIHTHPDASKLFMVDRFAEAAVQQPWYVLLAMVAAYSLILYLACTLTELVRIKLFELLHIPQLAKKILQFFRKLLFRKASE